MSSADNRRALLEVEHVSVRFGSAVALEDLNLVVQPGEIVGIVGPNGSGKTTVLNVLSGFVAPARGKVTWSLGRGVPTRPERLAHNGVGRTFQHPHLVSSLSAAANVAIAVTRRSEAGAPSLLDTVGVSGPMATRPTWSLSYGDRRLVDLARALSCASKALLLDEPTAGVDKEDWVRVGVVAQELANKGVAVIVTDHNLEFMRRLCSRAVFLHHGQVLAEGHIEDVLRDPVVVEAYVGRSAAAKGIGSSGPERDDDEDPVLRVQSVSAGYRGPAVIQDVSLDVGEGRLVALVGPNGAGKSTLLGAISGLLPLRAGSIALEGTTFGKLRPHERVSRGLSHVQEGRRIFKGLTVRENLAVARARSRRQTDSDLDFVCEIFPVLAKKLKHSGASLSGGEQQMLVIARALICRPRVLLLDEPTLGLAPLIIDQLLTAVSNIRDSGVGIIMTDQDARRLGHVADETMVLVGGRIVLRVPRGHFSGMIGEVEEAYLGSSPR